MHSVTDKANALRSCYNNPILIKYKIIVIHKKKIKKFSGANTHDDILNLLILRVFFNLYKYIWVLDVLK